MLPKQRSISQHEDKRDAGRVQCNELRTNLGEIVDASSTGLRIKGKLPGGTRPGSTLSIIIAGDEESLPLTCEVRWIKKLAFRTTTFGVSFMEITEDQRRLLWQMIRTGNVITSCSSISMAA
ncbi:MAG: PilZ domain-containing protein [Phycisphaerales bacterium]|nr:PilZ domain-containing protein [Phycisphaerales bacterium]MCB9835889.1 PilZ domain-containing protein [Phycisphaera sp.]